MKALTIDAVKFDRSGAIRLDSQPDRDWELLPFEKFESISFDNQECWSLLQDLLVADDWTAQIAAHQILRRSPEELRCAEPGPILIGLLDHNLADGDKNIANAIAHFLTGQEWGRNLLHWSTFDYCEDECWNQRLLSDWELLPSKTFAAQPFESRECWILVQDLMAGDASTVESAADQILQKRFDELKCSEPGPLLVDMLARQLADGEPAVAMAVAHFLRGQDWRSGSLHRSLVQVLRRNSSAQSNASSESLLSNVSPAAMLDLHSRAGAAVHNHFYSAFQVHESYSAEKLRRRFGETDNSVQRMTVANFLGKLPAQNNTVLEVSRYIVKRENNGFVLSAPCQALSHHFPEWSQFLELLGDGFAMSAAGGAVGDPGPLKSGVVAGTLPSLIAELVLSFFELSCDTFHARILAALTPVEFDRKPFVQMLTTFLESGNRILIGAAIDFLGNWKTHQAANLLGAAAAYLKNHWLACRAGAAAVGILTNCDSFADPDEESHILIRRIAFATCWRRPFSRTVLSMLPARTLRELYAAEDKQLTYVYWQTKALGPDRLLKEFSFSAFSKRYDDNSETNWAYDLEMAVFLYQGNRFALYRNYGRWWQNTCFDDYAAKQYPLNVAAISSQLAFARASDHRCAGAAFGFNKGLCANRRAQSPLEHCARVGIRAISRIVL